MPPILIYLEFISKIKTHRLDTTVLQTAQTPSFRTIAVRRAACLTVGYYFLSSNWIIVSLLKEFLDFSKAFNLFSGLKVGRGKKLKCECPEDD